MEGLADKLKFIIIMNYSLGDTKLIDDMIFDGFDSSGYLINLIMSVGSFNLRMASARIEK